MGGLRLRLVVRRVSAGRTIIVSIRCRASVAALRCFFLPAHRPSVISRSAITVSTVFIAISSTPVISTIVLTFTRSRARASTGRSASERVFLTTVRIKAMASASSVTSVTRARLGSLLPGRWPSHVAVGGISALLRTRPRSVLPGWWSSHVAVGAVSAILRARPGSVWPGWRPSHITVRPISAIPRARAPLTA